VVAQTAYFHGGEGGESTINLSTGCGGSLKTKPQTQHTQFKTLSNVKFFKKKKIGKRERSSERQTNLYALRSNFEIASQQTNIKITSSMGELMYRIDSLLRKC